MQTLARQRGWAGLIGLLLALLIVFLLGRTLLKQMGLLGGASQAAAVSAPGSAQTTVATPSVTAPMERARALQEQVREQARANEERIDKATQ